MMNDKYITKIYEITGLPQDLQRLERFFAMLHYSSQWGHSGTFAMSLDGDGSEQLIVSPEPKQFREAYSLTSGIGGDIEIAVNGGYTVCKRADMKSDWAVQTSHTLYKNGNAYKTRPDKLDND